MENCIEKFQKSKDLGYNSLDKVNNLKYNKNIIVNVIKENKIFPSWIDENKNIRGSTDKICLKKYSKKNEGILFIHGGGFDEKITPKSYRYFSYRLCYQTTIDIYCPDYISPPHGEYWNIIDNIYKTYVYMINKGCKKIYLVGDSAGATIVLSFINYMISNEKDNISHIESMILFSPWIDMECKGHSYQTRSWCEKNKTGSPLYRDNYKDIRNMYKKVGLDYVGSSDNYVNMLANPNYVDLLTLKLYPPTLIFVGDNETIRDDTLNLGRRAQKINSNFNIYLYDNMWHDWVMYSQGCGSKKSLKEANDALIKMIEFIDNKKLNKRNGVDVTIVDL